MLRRDVRSDPRGIDCEEPGMARPRLRRELAEQLLDPDRREHRVSLAEVRRVSRGAHLHARARRATIAERRWRSAAGRARRAGAGGRIGRASMPIREPTSRETRSSCRADELVGKDRGDRRRPNAAEPHRHAPSPRPRSFALLSPRTPWPSASATVTLRSAGGRNGAYASGSTAATSSGIANGDGGSSTTSPLRRVGLREPRVVARDDDDAADRRASARTASRTRPASRRGSSEERVRRLRTWIVAGVSVGAGAPRASGSDRGSLERERQHGAGDEPRDAAPARRRLGGAHATAPAIDAAIARSVLEREPRRVDRAVDAVRRPTRAVERSGDPPTRRLPPTSTTDWRGRGRGRERRRGLQVERGPSGAGVDVGVAQVERHAGDVAARAAELDAREREPGGKVGGQSDLERCQRPRLVEASHARRSPRRCWRSRHDVGHRQARDRQSDAATASSRSRGRLVSRYRSVPAAWIDEPPSVRRPRRLVVRDAAALERDLLGPHADRAERRVGRTTSASRRPSGTKPVGVRRRSSRPRPSGPGSPPGTGPSPSRSDGATGSNPASRSACSSRIARAPWSSVRRSRAPRRRASAGPRELDRERRDLEDRRDARARSGRPNRSAHASRTCPPAGKTSQRSGNQLCASSQIRTRSFGKNGRQSPPIDRNGNSDAARSNGSSTSTARRPSAVPHPSTVTSLRLGRGR